MKQTDKKIFIPKVIKGLICPDCGNSVKTTDGTWYECTNCRKIDSSKSVFTPKKELSDTDEMVAFAAIRMQPFTNGHFRIISQMMRDNDVVIIGLGSVGIERRNNNPFTAKERTEMIRKVFGRNSKDKLKIIPLHDIGATEREEWVEYCMAQIKGKQLPTPTKYYAGSETDLDWFIGSVNDNGHAIELVNLERHETNILSGTFVRQSLSTGTEEWKDNVPGCLVNFISDNYPDFLTLKYNRQKHKERNTPSMEFIVK